MPPEQGWPSQNGGRAGRRRKIEYRMQNGKINRREFMKGVGGAVAAERFINDAEADRILSRPMRSPWVL